MGTQAIAPPPPGFKLDSVPPPPDGFTIDADPSVKISENQKTSAVGDFLRGAASKLNPMEMLKGVEDTIHAIRTAPAETALQLGKEILLHPYMAIGRGIDAMKNGDIEQAAAHFNSALGAPVGGIEESAVKGATPGHRAEGIGELVGTGASAYLGAKGPAIVKATPGALKTAASTVGDVVSAAPAPSTAEVVTAFKHPLAAAGLYLKRAIPVIRESMAGGEAAPAAASAVEPPSIPGTAPAELDDVSKSLGYGKFSKLSPAQQDIVRRLAAQAAQQGAASPTIAPQQPVAGAVAQPAEVSTVPHPPFAENAPFSPSRAARQQTGAGTMAEGSTSIADAQQQAEGLAKLFKENGISANDLEKAPLDQWEGAAKLGGLAKPTKEVISRTLFELRKAERASPFAEKLKAALSQP